jgi:ubiquinone biosynthesis protein
MVPAKLLPTRLVFTSERAKVAIEETRPPSFFRGFFFLYQMALLGLITVWNRLTPAQYAHYVRKLLAPLGIVGAKLGQTLGMRSGQLPAEYAAELATLRDWGSGVPFATVRRTVERELNRPLERYFDEFSEAPFAATTSFQLHRARLRREQVYVVVKVLRPYAEDYYRRDIGLLRRLARWLQALRLAPKMRWMDLCREIEEVCTRELDLRYEAASLRQLRRNLPAHGVYVPRVFARYSTRRVLVMQFVHAALMADYIQLARTDPARLASWLEENNIRPRRLARRLFHSIWRQILEDNFFHADLTPYNVILLRNSRLAVIDCRSAGQLEAEVLGKNRRFIEAIADGDYATAAEYVFLLASRLPLVDLGEVKTEFVRVWRRWETRNYVRNLPAEEKSITRMLAGLGQVMNRYRFEAQWSVARLVWSVVKADSSILHLAADINYLHWLRQYFRAAHRRGQRIHLSEVAERSVRTLAAVIELPKTLLGDSIAQQEVLRRQARVFQGSTTKSGYVLGGLYSLLASALLLLGGWLGCAFLSQHHGVEREPLLGPQLSGAVRVVPAFGYPTWVGILLLVFVTHRRMAAARRAYLRQDVVNRPEARPAI